MSSGICPRCGNSNECAFSLNLPPEQCWCMSSVEPASSGSHKAEEKFEKISASQCYCQKCLTEIKQARETRQTKKSPAK